MQKRTYYWPKRIAGEVCYKLFNAGWSFTTEGFMIFFPPRTIRLGK